MSNKQILMFPLRNIVPRVRLAATLDFQGKLMINTNLEPDIIQSQMNQFFTNLGMMKRLGWSFSCYEQAGSIQTRKCMEKLSLIYTQNVA